MRILESGDNGNAQTPSSLTFQNATLNAMDLDVIAFGV